LFDLLAFFVFDGADVAIDFGADAGVLKRGKGSLFFVLEKD